MQSVYLRHKTWSAGDSSSGHTATDDAVLCSHVLSKSWYNSTYKVDSQLQIILSVIQIQTQQWVITASQSDQELIDQTCWQYFLSRFWNEMKTTVKFEMATINEKNRIKYKMYKMLIYFRSR